MILTGKAKEDFLYWNHHVKDDKNSNYARLGFAELNENLQNALITEWLDSVGVYIEVGVYPEENGDINFSYTIFGYSSSDNFEFYKSRIEATKQYLMKANEIYNKI